MSHAGRGTTDIILTNQHNFLNIATASGPISTSDHIPIILRTATSPIMIPTNPHFDFKNVNWEKFREELSTKEEIDIDNNATEKIVEETDKWFQQVTQAIEYNVPKTSYTVLPYPKISQEKQQIKKELKHYSTK